MKILFMVSPMILTFIIVRIIGARKIRKAEIEMIEVRRVMAKNNIFMS